MIFSATQFDKSHVVYMTRQTHMSAMANNHAMFASEVSDNSPVHSARDNEPTDVAVDTRSGARAAALRSVRMP